MLTDRLSEAHSYAMTHLCPNCGQQAALTARYSAKTMQYEVWCPRCGATDGFTSPKSLTAMWKAEPGSVPVPVANRMANKHRRSIESETEGLPDDLARAIREKYLG